MEQGNPKNFLLTSEFLLLCLHFHHHIQLEYLCETTFFKGGLSITIMELLHTFSHIQDWTK